MEFHCKSVEVFFFVFIELGEDKFLVAEGVLDGNEVVKGEVCTGVSFAVGCNGRVKDVKSFDCW